MTAMMTKPATPLALSESDKEAMERIESVIQGCELALGQAGGKVQKLFAMAQGIKSLRELITNKMVDEHIMPLMNTRLGFKTDKDPNRSRNPVNPYGVEIVKDCVIEAMLRGANVVGNEFNIISGQCYFTREFFERSLGKLPGVTNVVASPGVPTFESDPKGNVSRALLRFGLTWKVNGNPDCLRSSDGKPGRVFEIKADNYSSADQVIGKATRKAYSAAYKQICGSELAPPDGDVGDTVEGKVVSAETTDPAKDRTESLAEELGARVNGTTAAVTTAPTNITSEAEGNDQVERRGNETRANEAAKESEKSGGSTKPAAASETSDEPALPADAPALPNPAMPEWIAEQVSNRTKPAFLDEAAAKLQVLTHIRTKMNVGWMKQSRESQEVWYSRWMNGKFEYQQPKTS